MDEQVNLADPSIVRRDGSSPRPRKKAPVMTIVVFALVVVLWVAFGAALLLRQESLDTAWHAFRTAPLPLQALEGIVLLPWVVGLAIWEARWALWLRLLLIVDWLGRRCTCSSPERAGDGRFGHLPAERRCPPCRDHANPPFIDSNGGVPRRRPCRMRDPLLIVGEYTAEACYDLIHSSGDLPEPPTRKRTDGCVVTTCRHPTLGGYCTNRHHSRPRRCSPGRASPRALADGILVHAPRHIGATGP